MPLAIPKLDSLFSIWTKSLRVTGALPGATITVRSIGPSSRDVAKGSATGGADWLGLLPGVSIVPDDRLVVVQERAGSSSQWTPAGKAHLVTPVPTSAAKLQAVEIRSRLWECGEYIWIQGACPGATIEFSYGAATPETPNAPGGYARFRLTGKLSTGSMVSVRQITPIGAASPTNTTTMPVQPLPFPRSQTFPPPVLNGPLGACEKAVLVSGVFDGATVTVKRTAGPTETAGFDLDRLRFVLSTPLVKDEFISGNQAMPDCQRDGTEGVALQVGPPEALQPGIGPLCVGTDAVTVSNLQSGAVVHFDVNGTSYDLMPPPDETNYSFDIDPPLPAGTATVTQEICGLVSAPTVVSITAMPPIMTKPSLLTPLYACARSVTVKDVHPGAEVQVFAKTPTGIGPISLPKVFLSTVDTVDVSPHLALDDFVWAVERGCGSGQDSDQQRVVPHLPIVPPEIPGPVESGATNVTVKGVIPTATVSIFLLEHDAWKVIGYKAHADGQTTVVHLDRAVKTRDQLAATQAYCSLTTGRGPTVTVVKPRPLAPIITQPAAGATNAPYQSLTLSWSDPGVGTERAADTFDLELYDSAGMVVGAAGLTATSLAPTSQLKVGMHHTLKVIGRNSSGAGMWATRTFITTAPTPNLISFDQSSMMLTGGNFPPTVAVTLQVTHEIVGTIWIGDAPVMNDNRSKTLEGYTSDGAGKFSQMVDLVALLDLYDFLVPHGPGYKIVNCRGPLKGENVLIKAWYYVPGKGNIESNVLKFAWTKDTIVIVPS